MARFFTGTGRCGMSCGGFVWSTGEDLRNASDAAVAARLSQSGPLHVNGLQGNGTWRIRRDDEPPLNSYFIAYIEEFEDAAARSHMGDNALCTAGSRDRVVGYGAWTFGEAA